MAIYQAPRSSVADGYASPPELAEVRSESTLPSSFELGRLDIQLESEAAVRRSAGEIIATRTGEYLERTVQVVTPTETREVTITEVDVGAGSQRLQVVATEGAIVQRSDTVAQVESEPFVDVHFRNAGAVIESHPIVVATPPSAEAVPAEGVVTMTQRSEFTQGEVSQFVTLAAVDAIYDPSELTSRQIALLERHFGFSGSRRRRPSRRLFS